MQRKVGRHIWHALAMSIFLFSSNVYADVNNAATTVKWDYKGNFGPTYWGRLDPSFFLCTAGKSQSPIRIIIKKVNIVPSTLIINYQAAPMLIVDNGTTDLMIGHTQTIINDGHTVQLNFPANQSSESITFADKKYRLVQFHFHSPSENMLQREAFPLEIHFVHQSDDGQLAVIGVLAEVNDGKENPIIQKIIDNLPKDQGNVHAIENEHINPRDLLPAKQDYYSFSGSLTTPPCTEGVQWIVMANTINVSAAQIVRLRREIGGTNARPVQPLNKRVISYSVMK